jgi:hypothetical protein
LGVRARARCPRCLAVSRGARTRACSVHTRVNGCWYDCQHGTQECVMSYSFLGTNILNDLCLSTVSSIGRRWYANRDGGRRHDCRRGKHECLRHPGTASTKSLRQTVQLCPQAILSWPERWHHSIHQRYEPRRVTTHTRDAVNLPRPSARLAKPLKT